MEKKELCQGATIQKALGPRLPPGGDRGGGPAGQRQPGSPSAWPRVAGSSPTDPRVPPPFPSPGWGRRAAGCSPAAPAPPVSALWAGGRHTSPAAAPTALRLPRAGVLPSCCCRQGHEPTATSSLWRQAGGVQGTSVLLTGDPRLSEGREHGQGRARSSQSPAPPTGPGLPPRHTQARVCTPQGSRPALRACCAVLALCPGAPGLHVGPSTAAPHCSLARAAHPQEGQRFHQKASWISRAEQNRGLGFVGLGLGVGRVHPHLWFPHVDPS